MALYAFDGTGNTNEVPPERHTNVVKFTELYHDHEDKEPQYIPGVGTQLGAVGKAIGGLFGAGGRSRIEEMTEAAATNWANGDQNIDVIGFSRGAALAVHFTNQLAEDGLTLADGQTVQPRIRFLGLWDIVASFGLSFDTIVNFQEINLGWDVDRVSANVDHCFHAMALDERREAFGITRLNEDGRHTHIEEVWFRGVHSDIGGGNENNDRSNIALQWMLEKGRSAGLNFKTTLLGHDKYNKVNVAAPISNNDDVAIDPRRERLTNDSIHPTAVSKQLAVGESHITRVWSEYYYNWAGIHIDRNAQYRFSIAQGATWSDDDITCGPEGWDTGRLPFYQELYVKPLERRRRIPAAQWFELCGAISHEKEDQLFRIGANDQPIAAPAEGELYLFANDIKSDYDDNKGFLDVTITRVT